MQILLAAGFDVMQPMRQSSVLLICLLNIIRVQFNLLMSESNPQIYIRGFSKGTKEKDLETLFEKFGTIKQARIVNAYAFIGFENQDSVKNAVAEMNDYSYEGNKLKVEIAGKPKKAKGPQPNDVCRQCNKLGHWKNSCPDYKRRSDRDSYRRRRNRSSSSSSSSSSDRHKKKRRRRSPSSDSDSSSSSSSSSSRSRDNKRKKSRKQKSDAGKKQQ